MKKLALTLATLGLLSAPVLACPHSEEKAAEETPAPITAQKDKKVDAPKAKEQPKAPAKATEKKPAEKTTDTAKKTTEKKPDKVSAR